ncbi:hypothetical protein SO802_007328 [Lithocarpus litseifolius]|uniref:Uncharacterized protein n=1 Tax=Lithocarpus litseifolius TaxID=425828 RepID=A0AAW2DSI8_9ROSI
MANPNSNLMTTNPFPNIDLMGTNPFAICGFIVNPTSKSPTLTFYEVPKTSQSHHVLANLLGAWRIRILRLRDFVTTESDPGQCPFTLDDAFFLVAFGGKRFLNYVWVRLLSMGSRDHMQERSYLTRSLRCLWGERKTLGVWVRLLSMGPKVCIPERTISLVVTLFSLMEQADDM